jgi:hypothetical protein
LTTSSIDFSKWLTRRNAIRGFIAGVACAGGLLIAYLLLVVAPNLPSLDAVTDYRPKIPLRIYTADNALIGEFGEEHRDFIPIKDIPEMMKKSAGHRRQALLRTQRHRLGARAGRGQGQSGWRHAPGRFHHHHAGGA